MPILPKLPGAGQAIRESHMKTIGELYRSSQPKRLEGRGRHKSRLGWSIDQEEARPAAIVLGVLTGDMTECTGVYPTFVMGEGEATILDWQPGGEMTVQEEGVAVYSNALYPIAASAKLRKFGYHESGVLILLTPEC